MEPTLPAPQASLPFPAHAPPEQQRAPVKQATRAENAQLMAEQMPLSMPHNPKE